MAECTVMGCRERMRARACVRLVLGSVVSAVQLRMGNTRKSNGGPMGIHGNPRGIQWEMQGNPMGTPWESNRNSMGIQWKSNGEPLEIL